MKIEPLTKEIGGDVYTMPIMSPREGTKIVYTLARVISSGLAKFKEGDDLHKFAKAGSLLNGAFDVLDENEYERLIARLCAGMLVRNESGQDVSLSQVWERHFQRRIATIHKVAVWSLQENFADFFTDLLPGLGEQLQKLKVESLFTNGDQVKSGLKNIGLSGDS